MKTFTKILIRSKVYKHTFIKSFFAFALIAITSVTQAQQVLRVTTIPEEAATEQIRKFGPLSQYLEKTLGVRVEFTPVTDYPAAVEALVNKQVDLVWWLYLRSSPNQIRWKNHPYCTTRRRYKVSLRLHYPKEFRYR